MCVLGCYVLRIPSMIWRILAKWAWRRYGTTTNASAKDVPKIYGRDYLNMLPEPDELERIERSYAETGLPGCVGAVECSKMKWRNFPYHFKGQYLFLDSGAWIGFMSKRGTSMICTFGTGSLGGVVLTIKRPWFPGNLYLDKF